MLRGKRILISLIEAFYIIYMWNFFKTRISLHNIWEANIMSRKDIPYFIRHQINTGRYENKICELGNVVGYLLGAWVLLRENFIYNLKDKNLLMKKHKIMKLNRIVFIVVAIFSFIMNLNAFVYLLPVFIYELFYKVGCN